jgi:hypothetical protein
LRTSVVYEKADQFLGSLVLSAAMAGDRDDRRLWDVKGDAASRTMNGVQFSRPKTINAW